VSGCRGLVGGLMGALLLLLASLVPAAARTAVQTGETRAAPQLYLPIIQRPARPPVRLPVNYSPAATGLAVSPANAALVYAGTYGGGLYRSVDGGQNWIPASRGLPDSAWILSLLVDPVNPNRIYAGLSYNNDPGFASGVYRSDDGGATWAPTGRMDNPAAGAYSNHVVVYALASSSNGAVLYAATRTKVPVPPYTYGYGGVFKSTNGGQSWNLVNNGLPAGDLYVYDLAVDPTDANRVYAALHGSGVYVTVSGGSYWYAANAGIPPEVVNTTADRAIAVDPAAVNQLVFGTNEQETYGSDNYANRWDAQSVRSVLMFAVDHTQDHGLYAADLSGSIYYSPDFGLTWDKRAARTINGYIAADPLRSGVVYAGGFNGPDCLKQSVDAGESFATICRGINGYPVTGLVPDPAQPGHLLAALFGWGVVTSTDGGATWAAAGTGLPTPLVQGLAADPNQPNTLYALTLSDGIYRSTDGGISWVGQNAGYPLTTAPLAWDALPYQPAEPLAAVWAEPEDAGRDNLAAAVPVPALIGAVSPLSSSVVLVGTAGSGVLRWNGTTWVGTTISGGSVYAFQFDPTTPGRVWLGGDAAAGSLLVSVDQGATWSPSAAGLAGRTVYALSQGTADPAVLLAGTDAGAYLSRDGGASWSPVGPAAWPIRAVQVHPASSSRFLVASADAIYLSRDGGLTWSDAAPQFQGYGYLGAAAAPAEPGFFYFYSRYGGLIKVNE